MLKLCSAAPSFLKVMVNFSPGLASMVAGVNAKSLAVSVTFITSDDEPLELDDFLDLPHATRPRARGTTRTRAVNRLLSMSSSRLVFSPYGRSWRRDCSLLFVHEPALTPDRVDQRHRDAHRRARRRAAGGPLPWLPRALVLVAPPASYPRRGRVPRHRPRHAGLRRHVAAGGRRQLRHHPPDRRHARPARRPRRGAGAVRGPRLGRTRG